MSHETGVNLWCCENCFKLFHTLIYAKVKDSFGVESFLFTNLILIAYDDFCKAFLPHWNKQLLSARRPRGRRLSFSEIMTTLIHFHQSNYRNFKAYYLEYVMTHLRNEFPGLVSYNRFVELIPSVIVPLNACLGTCTGITFIDSTTLAVCKNPRIHCHKTFAGLAQRGKTSTGWFYGFKLHLIVNDRGKLIDFVLTPGNVKACS